MPATINSRSIRNGLIAEKNSEIVKLQKKLKEIEKERDILQKSNENKVILKRKLEQKDKEIQLLRNKVDNLKKELNAKRENHSRELQDTMLANQRKTEEKLENIQKVLGVIVDKMNNQSEEEMRRPSTTTSNNIHYGHRVTHVVTTQHACDDDTTRAKETFDTGHSGTPPWIP